MYKEMVNKPNFIQNFIRDGTETQRYPASEKCKERPSTDDLAKTICSW